jgi:hypothetical protein
MIAPVSERNNARRRQRFHHLFRRKPLEREPSSGVNKSGRATSEQSSDQDQRSKPRSQQVMWLGHSASS